MRPPERLLQAQEWLAIAETDAHAARLLLTGPGTLWTLSGYHHAQQAAEKAVKAVLIADGIRFPKSHALEELLDLLPALHQLRSSAVDWQSLSIWATQGRYPGIGASPSKSDAEAASHDAETVVSHARTDIAKG
jgi:HEPN domain-containing protein